VSATTTEQESVGHRPPSVGRMFLDRVAATPGNEAYRRPVGDSWESMNWGETGKRVEAIAAGLVALGIEPEQRVAIISSTRVDWALADFAILCAGAATTTIYPSTNPEDVAYILSDSGTRLAFAEDDAQIAKLRAQRADLPELTQVVTFDGTADGDWVLGLADLERLGAELLAKDPAAVTARVDATRPDHLATLIYTSGTTGRPKGVRLSHDCWVYEGVAVDSLGLLTSQDVQYLWLPLSHSFGKTLLCGIIHVGVPTYVDGRVDKLVDMLSVVKPTLMCAAPRIFEKVYNRTVTTALGEGGAKAKIFGWAVATGKKKVALEQARKPIGLPLKLQYGLAEKLVFSKLQNRLGGRLRVLVSGSAPLSRDIAEFFAAANLPIMEGYGLTESSAANFVNRLGKLKIGTVGLPLGDLECKIDSDGEVLLRGKPIMRGYHNLPKETEEAFTDDGFFRTGDIGQLDSDGYLTITDRKKDLVKTSGGKYIAPSAIEGMFKAVCPYTSQAVVVGQARNFVTMLISLDEDGIKAWAAGGPLAGKSYAEICASPETEKLIAGYVEQLNGKLNRWETIKKFTILPRDLSIEAGEITPSMKIKRRSVESNFAEQIDKMYAGSLVEM
jgi:long-chain acyl-CoA synthetase